MPLHLFPDVVVELDRSFGNELARLRSFFVNRCGPALDVLRGLVLGGSVVALKQGHKLFLLASNLIEIRGRHPRPVRRRLWPEMRPAISDALPDDLIGSLARSVLPFGEAIWLDPIYD